MFIEEGRTLWHSTPFICNVKLRQNPRRNMKQSRWLKHNYTSGCKAITKKLFQTVQGQQILVPYVQPHWA